MRSPIVAMLWELWRLTRSEFIFRLAIALVVGVFLLGATVLDSADASGADNAIALALFSGAIIHSLLSLALSKLNGGKFMDGYHPGFPLPLLYMRPVRTSMFVAVAMTYLALTAALSYLLWAVLMNATFDVRFPLLPIAAWLMALQLVQAVCYWAARSKFIQWAGSMGAYVGCSVLALRRAGEGDLANLQPDTWSMLFDYGLIDYALVAAIVLMSYGLTVVGVSRQRRGDASPARQKSASESGSVGWLSRWIRLPCPTSSPLRALIWFDLKSSGLAILGTGIVAAIICLSLTVLGAEMAFIRSFALSAPLFSTLLVLVMGANAFGIRRRQGRTYASVFDITQAVGTGSLAGLRILVRSVCVSLGLAMVAVSAWISVPIVNRWPDVGREGAGLQQGRDALEAALLAMTTPQHFALTILAFGMIVLLVTVRASIEALFARYRRRVIIALVASLAVALAFTLSRFVNQSSVGLVTLADAMLTALALITAAAIMLATLYLFRRTVAENLLTRKQVTGGVLMSALFAAAWLSLTYSSGLRLSELSLAGVALVSLPVVLPLFASVLAPWSLSRMRHI